MTNENVIKLTERDFEDNLKQRIRGLLDAGITQAQIAREVGVSASALNTWLKDNYAGDNAALESKLAAWLHNRDTETEARMPEPPQWVDTDTSRKILTNLSYARALPAIVPIYGCAGVGKTRSAKRYAETNPNTWIITMSPDTGSIAAAMEEIAQGIGLKEITGRAARVRREVVRKLKGTRGLLIIDEAQYLTVPALEAVRRIFDEAEVGLALLGNDTVYARLSGGSRGADFARLYSRLGNRVNIKGVTQGDAKAMISAWGIADREQVSALIKICRTPGGIRSLNFTMKMAMLSAIGENESLRISHIRQAWNRLGDAA